MKKKLRHITAAAVTLILSIAHVPAVMAQQDANVYSTVILSNGEEKQINQNPYGSGVNRLEYRIIEEMRKAATELGIDTTTDTEYQHFESYKYNVLNEDIEYRDALQVDFCLKLIQDAKKMIQDAIDAKKETPTTETPATENPTTETPPMEELITEGIFAGFTKQEKQDLLIQVYDHYVRSELVKVDIKDNLSYFSGVATCEYIVKNTFKYSVPQGSVSGDNYIVRDVFVRNSSEMEQVRQQVAKYFADSSFYVEKLKTYPEDHKLTCTIGISIKRNSANNIKEASSMVLYHISTDGTVTKVPHTYLNDDVKYFDLLTFQTDELGYFAWGAKNEALVEEPEPTETPVENPAPTDTVISPSKVSPKTGDSMNVVIPIILMLSSMVVLVGMRYKEQLGK